MAWRLGRIGLAVMLAIVGIAPGQIAHAKTGVTVDGATVTLTVPVDLIGAIDDAGGEVGLKDDRTGERAPVSAFWGAAAKAWNDAFSKLSYKGCVTFNLDLKFFSLPYFGTRTPGHHAVLIDPNPDVRPGFFDPSVNDATIDSPSAFTMDLQGEWGAEPVEVVSHEVGHLLGLGDDYTDVKDANGKVTGSTPAAGRAGTMMAGGSNIDQALVDRISNLVEKAGQKLPKCWTGTMSSSSNQTVTAADGGLVCSATWTTALKITVAADSTVSGTATSTMQGAPVCAHPEYFLAPVTTMSSSISGTATATQLQLQLHQVSYGPAGSIADATGMSASIYGINTASPTITITVTSPGHAAGTQQLQTISGVNSYTSDNTITLDCQTC